MGNLSLELCYILETVSVVCKDYPSELHMSRGSVEKFQLSGRFQVPSSPDQTAGSLSARARDARSL